MAAAEERRAGQQTANHFLARGETRIGPKLYCSLSRTFAPQSDGRTGNAANKLNANVQGCMSYNFNNPCSDLPHEIKWWLHLQSNSEHHGEFSRQQLNALEPELKSSGANLSGPKNYPFKEQGVQTDPNTKRSANCMLDDQDLLETKALIDSIFGKGPDGKDVGEFSYADDDLTDLETSNWLASEEAKKLRSELESHLVREEKAKPWWRTADNDELASLVFSNTLGFVENCDLPRPETNHLVRAPSSNQTVGKGLSTLVDCLPEKPSSVCVEKTLHCSDRSISINNRAPSEGESDFRKTQLLEALCHSQTRARQAERKAQQAYDEKEHMVKLFLREASHLFAYKQWYRVLQLEILCLQLNNEPPTCARKKIRYKTRRKMTMRLPGYGKLTRTFALMWGLSLAGAGLMLGWTMGWWFTSF